MKQLGKVIRCDKLRDVVIPSAAAIQRNEGSASKYLIGRLCVGDAYRLSYWKSANLEQRRLVGGYRGRGVEPDTLNERRRIVVFQ